MNTAVLARGASAPFFVGKITGTLQISKNVILFRLYFNHQEKGHRMSANEKRITITFTDESYHRMLARWSKDHQLTQGEVIEVMLDNVRDEHFMEEAMDERRKQKVAGRTSIRAMIQKTKGMTPEERQRVMGKLK